MDKNTQFLTNALLRDLVGDWKRFEESEQERASRFHSQAEESQDAEQDGEECEG